VDVTVNWDQLEYFVGYTALTYGRTYYWRVLARDPSGWTIGEPVTGSFMTVPPPVPDVFELISPGEGEEGVATGPLFTWSESRNAESYVLEVGEDATFTTPLVSQFMYSQGISGFGSGSVGYQLADATLPMGQTLYWRVTAGNTYGDTVSSPAAVSFATAPPPSCVGDIDDDGDTDIFDFAVFAANFERTGVGPGEGDLDGDGAVTVLDFGLFAADFTCVE
jgi:hypothetical protein